MTLHGLAHAIALEASFQLWRSEESHLERLAYLAHLYGRQPRLH